MMQIFGEWLVGQQGRTGWVGQLGDAASRDRSFPRQGDIGAVRAWLGAQRASGDDWEALEDAEREYAGAA